MQELYTVQRREPDASNSLCLSPIPTSYAHTYHFQAEIQYAEAKFLIPRACVWEKERDWILPKRDSMRNFESLPVFIRIEVCLNEQRIDNARNQTKNKYIAQKRRTNMVIRVFGGGFLVIIFFFIGRWLSKVFPSLHSSLSLSLPIDWIVNVRPKWVASFLPSSIEPPCQSLTRCANSVKAVVGAALKSARFPPDFA